MPTPGIRSIESGDRHPIAEIIFASLNAYYESIGRGPLMLGTPEEAAGIFFDVYQRLDPGEGIVALCPESGHVNGVCFVHPRETHVSLGIVAVRPEAFGQGIAKALVSAALVKADALGLPARLVSSCFNLDSYSLYTRRGFVPFSTFQDVMVPVPEDGVLEPAVGAPIVRPAAMKDVESMGELERSVSGISRRQDYRYFIENADTYWSVSVVEGADGLDGFMVSSGAPNFNMIGPGVARTEDVAIALLHRELCRYPGRTPVVLAPVDSPKVVRALYAWGGRNIEMHVAQSRGPAIPAQGVVFPTFLPESG